MRAHIGPDLVRSLTSKNLDIRDTQLRGFCLRCRASGKHSYLVLLGRGRSKTIGRVGVTPVETARVTAATMLASVSRSTLSLMADDPTLTLREATTKARGAVRRKVAGLTFGTYVRDTYGPWVVTHRRTGDKTVEVLERTFKEFADVRLTEINAFAIERWRSARHKAGISASTTNRNLAALRGALSRAVEWGLLKAHPLARVKAAKIDAIGHMRYLSADEEQRLMDALTARDDRRRAERETANAWRRERAYDELPAFGAYTDHLTPIVLVALNTGCRRGELFDLQWGDVDLAAGRLTIRVSKSGEGRKLPLNTVAARVLTAWRPAVVAPSTYVFPGPEGERMTTLKTAFLAIMKAAKITGFRFHDLRHTFASNLVQAGVDLERLRKLLGHESTLMVTRYAHLRDQDLAEAVAKLAKEA